MPKNWKEARPQIVWAGLVAGFFFAFADRLVEQQYGQAIFALLSGLTVSAVALHSKTWLDRTNPNWAYGAFLALLLAIVLSPFVEQHRWPFSTVFHDAPTAEDIATATAPIQAQLDAAQKTIGDLKKTPPAPIGDVSKLTAEREKAIKDRDDALKELDEIKHQLAPILLPSSVRLLFPPSSEPKELEKTNIQWQAFSVSLRRAPPCGMGRGGEDIGV